MAQSNALITPETARFVILSFEGPDAYSQAGGLGVRVAKLGQALARAGYETNLIFVGDPNLPGEESFENGLLKYNRWCQWISKYYPTGVYEGEEQKEGEYYQTAPQYVLDHIARPAINSGKILVVMAEEWQTSAPLMHLSDLLNYFNLRHRVVMLWNANHIFSFWRINFDRLKFISQITTVSKFMKQRMWAEDVNPIVIPNGIPEELFQAHDPRKVRELKKALDHFEADLKIFKIGRFSPDKRWLMAVQAIAGLKAAGRKPVFLIRGGAEPHGLEVRNEAMKNGLSIHDLYLNKPSVAEAIEAMAQAPKADIISLNFFMPEELVNLLYKVADATLANSGFEPFGLVGLEVMANGGLVFTGSTGEEYLIPFVNGVSVETEDPREIVTYLQYLADNPEVKGPIKKAAVSTARYYAWPRVIDNLVQRCNFIAARDGMQAGR